MTEWRELEGEPSDTHPIPPLGPCGLRRAAVGHQCVREAAEEKLRAAAAVPVGLDQAGAADVLPCMRAVECGEEGGTEKQRRRALSAHKTAPGFSQN